MPYNDANGLSRDHEVIYTYVRPDNVEPAKESNEYDSVGNIGIDDFICIVPQEQTEPICKIHSAIFSIIVFNSFGEEEKAGGTCRDGLERGGAEDTPTGHVDLRYA